MKIGSLFSGVAGLDRAVEAVTGATPGWLDGLTPAQQLKAAGNAVCAPQAELALRILLGDSDA